MILGFKVRGFRLGASGSRFKVLIQVKVFASLDEREVLQ